MCMGHPISCSWSEFGDCDRQHHHPYGTAVPSWGTALSWGTAPIWGATPSRGRAWRQPQLPRRGSCSYKCASCGCCGPCFLSKGEGGRPAAPRGLQPRSGRALLPENGLGPLRTPAVPPHCPSAPTPLGSPAGEEAAALLLVWFGIFCSVAMTTVPVTSSGCLSPPVGCIIFLPEPAAAFAPAHLGPRGPAPGARPPAQPRTQTHALSQGCFRSGISSPQPVYSLALFKNRKNTSWCMCVHMCGSFPGLGIKRAS